MFSRKKTVTRHRTATIAMAAVLVVSLAGYFISEKILRTAMLKPIKREKVDFSKVLDWLPPKAKAELEYRARYLDLRQKYDEAQSREEKLRTAYALACHTRDMDEHNSLMLQFIDNPAYAGMRNLHEPYVRMLRDPKNPKAISVQKYYEFINTLTDPEQIYLAWRDGRDRLGRLGLRNLHIVHAEFLLPLLDRPEDSYFFREYAWQFENLRNNAKRIANDIDKRVARQIANPGEAEYGARMRKAAQKAEQYRLFIIRSWRTYNSLADYRKALDRRAAYEKTAPEKKLDAAIALLRQDRTPSVRRAVVDALRKDPKFRADPKMATLYALLADDMVFVDKVLHPYLEAAKDPVVVYRTWREVCKRVNAASLSAHGKLDVLLPLMSIPLEKIPFRDYEAVYELIERCAIFENDRDLVSRVRERLAELKKKPSYYRWSNERKKQEAK